jgi:hypothetical protein
MAFKPWTNQRLYLPEEKCGAVDFIWVCQSTYTNSLHLIYKVQSVWCLGTIYNPGNIVKHSDATWQSWLICQSIILEIKPLQGQKIFS